MTFKKRALAAAVNAAMVGGVTLAGTTGSVANAAQANEILDEVVVTGSRIKRRDFTSNAPVATVDFEQIDLTGTVNTESLLNTLPQTVPGLDRTSNNPGNGTATVNLRGLGSNRTLVLVNGTRAVPTTQGGTVDINQIPTALISQIEVLTGGASAVYGSDAVAGVVNFILKDDFEGVSISGGYETTEENDAAITSVDVTFGANLDDGRGNVAINLMYTDREDLFQGDRDFSFFAQFDATGADGNPILIDGGSSGIPATNIRNSGFDATAYPAGIVFEPNGEVRAFRTGPDNDFYNYAPVNYIQLPQTRYQASALASYDITDKVEAYGRFMYTSSKVPQQLAPTPIFETTTFTLDGNPFISPAGQQIISDAIGVNYNAMNLPAGVALTGRERGTDPTTGMPTFFLLDDSGNRIPNNPDDLSLGFKTTSDSGVLIDSDGDGIGDNASALLRRRLLEVGPRVSDDSFSSYQVQVGLRGELGDSGWTYDAYYQTGTVDIANVQLGNVNRDRFRQALMLNLAADPTGGTCQNTAANGSTISCVPINIFGEGNISEQGAAFLRTAVAATGIFEQSTASAVVSGDLFELPGGDASVALGVEHIENRANFQPSQDLAAGTIAGFNGSPASGGSYDGISYFGEAYLPILAEENLAHLLDLELAIRTTDYSTVGSVTSYKIAASWAPVPDFRFRAGFNTAVRAPSIAELFSPVGEGFPSATDPCAEEGNPGSDVIPICEATGVPAGVTGSPSIDLAAGQVRELSGGNPNLQEESAETLTFGIVVEPSALEGLSFSVDYFDIEIEDYISEFGGGANNILSVCYNPNNPSGGIGSIFCNAVDRRPDGTINAVSATVENVALQTLKGFDLLASFETELFGGDLAINYVGTFTTEHDFLPFAGGDVIGCAGKFGADCGGTNLVGEIVTEYKHRMTFRWYRGDWTAQLLWRYIGKSEDDDPTETFFVEELEAESYFDVTGAYRFNDNYSVTFGIDNLLDKEPPILGDNQEQANTYPATYDVFGRTYFVKVRADF